MKRLLTAIAQRLRRPRRTTGATLHSIVAAGAPGAAASHRDRRVTQSLCDGLDRAMQLGLWAHADRVAATALRWAPKHPGLTERLARLRLAQGHPETALAIIDACPVRRASIRLLRAVCLMNTGRRDEAHADLHGWSRRSSAPLDARRLLALLDWEGGDRYGAAAALLRNLTHLEDPQSLAMLVLLAVEQGRSDQAERWAQRLREAAGWVTTELDTDVVLQSVGMPGRDRSAEPGEAQIEHLSTELVGAESAIRLLVEAQRREPQPAATRLLAAAIERALPGLRDAAAACESLARLAIIQQDRAEAGRWARRGLELNPMSAPLAMLLDEARDAPTRAAGTDDTTNRTTGRAA